MLVMVRIVALCAVGNTHGYTPNVVVECHGVPSMGNEFQVSVDDVPRQSKRNGLLRMRITC